MLSSPSVPNDEKKDNNNITKFVEEKHEDHVETVDSKSFVVSEVNNQHVSVVAATTVEKQRSPLEKYTSDSDEVNNFFYNYYN